MCIRDRTFSRVELLELKRRTRHLDTVALKDEIQIALEAPSELGALVHRQPTTPAIEGQEIQFVWRPRSLVLKAQRKYSEFFGVRYLASRSLKPATLEERANQLLKVRCRAPLLQPPQKKRGLKVTKHGRRELFVKSAAKLVDEMRARKSGQASLPVRTMFGTDLPASSVSAAGPTESAWSGHQGAVIRRLHARKVEDAKAFAKAEKSTGLSSPPPRFFAPRTNLCSLLCATLSV